MPRIYGFLVCLDLNYRIEIIKKLLGIFLLYLLWCNVGITSEADGYLKSYEDTLFSNGKTVKTQRLLDVFQCKETAAVKAKI